MMDDREQNFAVSLHGNSQPLVATDSRQQCSAPFHQ